MTNCRALTNLVKCHLGRQAQLPFRLTVMRSLLAEISNTVTDRGYTSNVQKNNIHHMAHHIPSDHTHILGYTRACAPDSSRASDLLSFFSPVFFCPLCSSSVNLLFSWASILLTSLGNAISMTTVCQISGESELSLLQPLAGQVERVCTN